MTLNSTHTDRPLSTRARILIGVILTILVILLHFTHKGPTGDIPERTNAKCATEDEVLVRVESDSYEFHADDAICIHIDQLRGGG